MQLLIVIVLYIFRRILKSVPPIPKSFSPEVTDFILRLLTKEPEKRLGAGGAEEVKKHPFFRVGFKFKLFMVIAYKKIIT